MSAKMRTGQTAEIAGPKKALVVPNPKVAASMIKRAERPLLVIGSKSTNIPTKDGDLIDTAIRFKKIDKITVVATGHLIKIFKERGTTVYSMPMMNLGDRLRDPAWKGFDGNGQYDLILFAGAPYYMEWLVQSGLKNFAPELKTMSLGNSYQPNAQWSMGSTPSKKWQEELDEILVNLEEAKK
jgi:acetyl-CoA decarbonylase/synthase complex subunit epsilon